MNPSTDADTRFRRAIATVCLSGSLEDKLDAAAAAGFDGVEIFEADLLSSMLSPSEIRARVADLGMTIDLYQPFRDGEGVPGARFASVLDRMRAKLDLMATLGTDTVLVCSSVAPDTVCDDAVSADQLRQLADLAAARGMRIAYEALAWGRHVSTWEHSWRIVQRADHPSLGLCLDSFHILSKQDDLTGLDQIPGERIFFLQLADAPQLAMSVLQWSRHHRLFPLQGAFALPEFVDAVMRAGYSGPLSLEVFNDVFRQAEPHRTAIGAMRSLVALQDRLSPHDRAHQSLPAAATLTGVAFVELGVDRRSGPQLQRTLRALGFTHSGQHRSKPVQLWELGSARVLLNSAADGPPLELGGAGISAFALESQDPQGSARRAAELGAVSLPRQRDHLEADISAVAAPDGTQVFFCRTDDAEGSGWLGDFLATSEPSSPANGIMGVDHISFAQPFDRFDEARLFLKTVAGLVTDWEEELAAPFGLIRASAMSNAARTLRIGLSVPVLRRGGWAPQVRHPQHVTLVTADIEGTVHALTEAGAPLIAIPQNYYDDLQTRHSLDPDLLAFVRRIGATYDADAGGCYLQVFTPILGGRVFFEVVQRLGDYRGYGFVNDPIRMAAHRFDSVARREDCETQPVVTSSQEATTRDISD